jgi:hypothetical protein
MKQLFKISFDLALNSLSPIVSWFVLSLILDSRLINIFSITYPIQFLWLLLRDIFATGANISGVKDKNPHAANSGILLGAVVSGVIFGGLALNIDHFIRLMNADPVIYHDFSIYIVLQLWIQLVVTLVIEKLYYRDENSRANKISFSFNLLNFAVLIGSALIFKQNIAIITTTLVVGGLFAIIISAKELKKFRFKLNILRAMKYNSMDILENIILFFVYLFGVGHAFGYGEDYALAITFAALVTDIQWDVATAIQIKAKIDIAKKRMNFKKSFREAYVLLAVLILTSVVAFLGMKNFYELNIKLAIIYTGIEYYAYLMFPQYRLKMDFLQLEFSPMKTTFVKLSAMILRLVIVILLGPITPFALMIGQVSAQMYQVIMINWIFHRRYHILNNGRAVKNRKK